METKIQTVEVSKKSSTDKKLKFNYSELDDFLNSDIDLNKDLAKGFRGLHCSYSDLITQVAFYNYVKGSGETYINGDATRWIFQLEELFRILENLKENKE